MNRRLEAILFKLLFLTLAGIMAAQMLGQSGLASALFTLTFPLTFGVWLGTLWRRIRVRNGLVILILVASGVSVAVNALLTNTVVSPAYFKKLIMFWSTIVLFGAGGEHQTTGEEVRFLFLVNSAAACFFVGMFFLKRETMYLLNGSVTMYLTFRFTNPNLAAAFLSAGAMIELIQLAAAQKRLGKLFHAVLAGFLIYFVFQTRSRNAQLILALFLAVWWSVRLFSGKTPRMTGWVAALIAAAPLLFALGYLLLVYHPSVQETFSFLYAEGKNLDSRVTIWRFALGAFLSSPVFGAYSQISEGTGASQMHNSHLDVLASYGMPVFLMVWLLLVLALMGSGKPRKGQIHFLCQFGLAAQLLYGTGEAILFSGGMGIYLFAGMLGLLANYDFEDRAAWQ